MKWLARALLSISGIIFVGLVAYGIYALFSNGETVLAWMLCALIAFFGGIAAYART